MMKCAFATMAAVAMISVAWNASAAELRLFGAPLSNASEEQLISLAKQSGARLSSQANGVDVFDVTAMQLPGIKSLILAFHGGKFALARYSSKSAGGSDFGMDNEIGMKEDEKLRKMLLSHYGQPAPQQSFPEPSPFGDEYVSQGRYDWRFDAGMRLSYNKPFMGETTLTYFNPAVVSQLKRDANAANDDVIKSDATRLRNKF